MTITLNTDYDVALSTALLGYVGETNARPVSVEGMEIDGADRYVLTIDYGDGVQYEVDITGGTWTPTADILRSAQTVSCQIAAKKLSGDEYVLVKKSRIFRLRIGAAIGDTAIPSPNVAADALDKIDAIGRQAHADMQTAVTAAETATTAANNAAKSVTNAEKSADTATQAASRAETAKTAVETSATQAETARQGAETARQQAVKSQNSAKVSAAQASASAQQTEADKTITAGYAKTAKTCADSTAADRQAVADMATQVTADKATVADHAAQVAEDRTAAETAAQTAQAVADSLPDDYTTAVGKIAENTAEIGRVKLSDKELQRRVNALYDMENGITHQFETDTDTAYTKTVPTGAKLMSVKSVGGKSLVWNQLVSQLEEATFAGVTGVKLNDKTLQISGTSTGVVFLRIVPVQTAIIGHKYLFYSHASDTTELSNLNGFYNNESDGNKRFYEYGKGTIFTNVDNAIEMRLRLNGDVTVNFQITPQLFDLTAMFGTGNEPSTVEEFEKIFPADYYPYNAGEIISAGTESVVEQGRNLINADDYYASYKQSDGSYVNDSVGFANINIPIGKYIGKTLVATLKATVSAQPTSFFWLARIDGDRVESLYAKGERVLANTTGIAKLTFTPKTKNDTLSMSYGQGRGDVLVRDIQIELGDTPTAYAPFHRNTYQIPEAIRNLPGYGWSAGTARNYVDYENKQYHQCVQSVDLGTLTWTYGNLPFGWGDNQWFSAPIQSIKVISTNTQLANVLCEKYTTRCAYVADGNDFFRVDKSIGQHQGAARVTVLDTAYTDAAAFKQAMQGVILYYELANPIVTDISNLTDDDFLRNIEVEAGGSITFKNSNDSYRIPVPSEEEYIVKLSEIGGTT